MRQSIDLTGTRVFRGDTEIMGTVTTRDGANYLIAWDDGGHGFVIAAQLEAAVVGEAYSDFASKHRLRDRAREARASLEAIRSGKPVAVERNHASAVASNVAGGVALSDADRKKILARLSADRQKSAPLVSPPKRETPATPQTRDDRGAHAASVSKHVRALLASKAKN